MIHHLRDIVKLQHHRLALAKGISKKLALIAVTNKLLKQAFAIAKSGICYDKNYRNVLAG
jgi:hypothetical protein